MFFALNGALHGPVHIMIGGHWGFSSPIWSRVTAYLGFTDAMLLLSKVLWRQGYVRCPSACSVDSPESECTCSCPAAILQGRSAVEVLNITGVLSLNPNSNLVELMEANDLSWNAYLEE